MVKKTSLEDMKQVGETESDNPLYKAELSHHLSQVFSHPTDSLKTIEKGQVSEWLTELLA